MIADIATYPLRMSVRTAARLYDAIETGFNLARYVAEALLPSDAVPAPKAPRRRAPARREPVPAAQPRPEPEPAHVSEEPVVVAEVADEGAEDGVGAQVSIAEPWDGYRRMKAGDVIARVEDADAAQLAVVQLFEAQGRGRKTVLAAVERRLKAISSPASRG